MSKELAEYFAMKFFPHLALKYGVRCVLVAAGMPDNLFEQ